MKSFIIRIIFVALSIYAVFTFISQQKLLNAYAKEKKEYSNQIEQANETKQELTDTLQSLNSTEYIESIAREKLDMYLPNEKVYIDITQ